MRLDTISRIEQFMTDALLSSPLIPLGVNVIRLAATEDEEGIAVMARTIVVRYTGSTVNVTNIALLKQDTTTLHKCVPVAIIRLTTKFL